jgi:hypothetical protein
MKNFITALLPIAALAALVAGAAAGQTPASNGLSDPPMAVSATQAGMPTAATIGAGGVISSPTPADQAYTLKAGEPNVVSNGPVPDTLANRRLYGGPTSNAGRHTAPRGN